MSIDMPTQIFKPIGFKCKKKFVSFEYEVALLLLLMRKWMSNNFLFHIKKQLDFTLYIKPLVKRFIFSFGYALSHLGH